MSLAWKVLIPLALVESGVRDGREGIADGGSCGSLTAGVARRCCSARLAVATMPADRSRRCASRSESWIVAGGVQRSHRRRMRTLNSQARENLDANRRNRRALGASRRSWGCWISSICRPSPGAGDDDQAHLPAEGDAAVSRAAARSCRPTIAACIGSTATSRGRVKCVACYMCSTACPAHCIDIVAAPSPVAGPREVSGDLRHRRTALHLLRHVRAGLPVRRHRIDLAVRSDRA